MRTAQAIAWAIAVTVTVTALAGAGCRTSPRPTTSLRLHPTEIPKSARVTIDDEVLGPLQMIVERGVALPPGKHRITIEAEGFLPWDAEVDAGDRGGLLKLDVKLVRIPE